MGQTDDLMNAPNAEPDGCAHHYTAVWNLDTCYGERALVDRSGGY